jgi:hypothetical protein
MELHEILGASIGTCILIYMWMRKEKQMSFEEGVCYALAEHAKKKIQYKVYKDDDGDQTIEVIVNKEKK